ncbi:ribonucleotide-diphosphate reductase subunit beta [Streptococcus equi]|uniref:ribonucleotide-diphosphate reductase subunit beta n=1 Tax=Streptococcus equi TaxID=1336 RepID=UPI0039C670DE
MTQNFWLPEKVPVSNDLNSWRSLGGLAKAHHKTYTGLTLLDTVQAQFGDVAQIQHSLTDHEQVIYTNFAFMVAIHARSYGTIFFRPCAAVSRSRRPTIGGVNRELTGASACVDSVLYW